MSKVRETRNGGTKNPRTQVGKKIKIEMCLKAGQAGRNKKIKAPDKMKGGDDIKSLIN